MIKMLYGVRDRFTRFLVPFVVLLTAEAFPVWFSHDYLYHDVAIWNLCRNLQKQIHSFASLSCLVGLETTSQKLDNSAVGIRGTLAKLSQLVAKYDAELQHHLEITTEVSLHMLAYCCPAF